MKSLRANGERTAIESGGRSLLYKDLLRISNGITGTLLREIPGRETLVGIQLTDRTQLICAIIGTLHAGCVFVPINPALPPGQRAAMMEDLGLQHLIVSKEDPGPHHCRPYYFEDMTEGAGDGLLKEVDYPDFHPDDGIYVYFTSGSTGRPKGIVGKNRSLLQYLQWEIGEFRIDHTIRVSQFISPYFDAFLRDIFVPLLAGGTICIPPAEEDFFTPRKMADFIDGAGISLIHCVPSLLRVISNGAVSAEKFRELRYLLLSGEKIIPSELIPWYAIFEDRVQLVNLYGATETTMIRSFYRITPGDAKKTKISIGRPIHDTELLVLDKDLQPCALYVTGDLYIRTPYATKGYLNAPALTREKFLPGGPGTADGTVTYKTGDRARLQPDGEIDLIGREDRQVKLRGIRIELDEIEYVLGQSPLVKSAIVIKHTAANNGVGAQEYLMAFVIRTRPSQTEEELEKELGTFLRERLAEYMIPAVIAGVEEFPLLNNGKVNYKELLNKAVTGKILAPANETETALLAIWKEILGDMPISTEEPFHRIGGNSLSIMRLIAKIYNRFSVRITLHELVTNLTIKKQAELVGRSARDHSLAIPLAEPRPAYHLSSAQERIYYHYQLDKNGTSYNLPMAIEMKTDVDPDRIKSSFRALLERHESLRTQFVFDKDQGRIMQVIRPEADLHIGEIELEECPIDTIITGFIKPFDPAWPPLVRATIVTVGGKKKLLLIDIHHIVCDGQSQVNLLSDLFKLYQGEALKPLKIQYRDYAEWEHHLTMTQEYIAHREFWLRSFDGGIPRLELPVTGVGAEETPGDGGRVFFRVDRSSIAAFTDLLRKEDLTLFSGLLAVWFLYLSQLTGQDDIVVGINSSGRIQEELEDQVGMYAKTLPIRLKIDPTLRFRDLVKNLHHYLLQAYSNQVYDLVDIMRELKKRRAFPPGELFGAMFSFLNFREQEWQSGKGDFTHCTFENGSAKYPLHLFAGDGEDGILFRLEYLAKYFTHEDALLLSTQFQSLIRLISENPDAGILTYAGKGDEGSFVHQPREIVFKF